MRSVRPRSAEFFLVVDVRMVTERSEVLPQLQFGEHESSVAREPVVDVGDAQLTQLGAGQRRGTGAVDVISDVT